MESKCSILVSDPAISTQLDFGAELIFIKCDLALLGLALPAFLINHATDLHWLKNPTSFLPQGLCICYFILSAVFPDLPSSAKYYFPKTPSVITLFKVIESFPTNHSWVSMVCFVQNTYHSRILSSIFTRFYSLSSVCPLKEVSCNRARTLLFHFLFCFLCQVLLLAYDKCVL